MQLSGGQHAVLDWLTRAEHRSTVVTAGGLVRCDASQE
jgi:hypothetical protein